MRTSLARAKSPRRRPWTFSSFLFLLLLSSHPALAVSDGFDRALPGIQLPDHLGFGAAAPSDSPCVHADVAAAKKGKGIPLKLQIKSRSSRQKQDCESVMSRDRSRIQMLNKRIAEKRSLHPMSSTSSRNHRRSMLQQQRRWEGGGDVQGPGGLMIVGTLESGVTQGSGEYFVDVLVGVPPRHFSLILDTGSDLNWIQCLPCHDCFEQTGPHYDPSRSSSHRTISCTDDRCALVSSPRPPHPCRHANQSCPYFYWYGDYSNTTGELASDVFALENLHREDDEPHTVENVLFGCGHWNRGLFHGAAGLLGLGRGPLSFMSQLRSMQGHAAFSYCLVDRNSNASVSGRLFLGEDGGLIGHPDLNFTSLVSTGDKEDTFYYVGMKGFLVGNEMIPLLEPADGGGTIVDSGSTLSYFAEPAYGTIRDAFVRQMGGTYPRVEGFPVLDPCYNISGGAAEVPDFAILFKDGATWNFPAENYFLWVERNVVCLAMLPTPRASTSILGNHLQQNFHVIYDLNAARLGFAPADCANL